MGELVFDHFLIHLDLVGIVDDAVELVETSVVDKHRRSYVSTILDISVPINVCYRLTVFFPNIFPEFPNNFIVSAMIV